MTARDVVEVLAELFVFLAVLVGFMAVVLVAGAGMGA